MRRTTFVHHTLSLLLAAAAIAFVAPSAGSEAASRVDLGALKSAVNAQVSAARRVAPAMGIHVVEASSGREVYGYNSSTKRILASNTKLFTSAAALDVLGPGFFFETPLYLRGKVKDGVLHGDLAVVGGGDPNISGRHWQGDSYAVFRQWAQALRARGVRRISGHVILATGLFDLQLVHPDWPEDQLDRWYEAPVAALSFNDNCVLVKVEPYGSDARVRLVPELPIFEVDDGVALTSNPRQEYVRIGRPTLGSDWQTLHTFQANGRIHRGTEFVDKWVTVADPAAYFGTALRQALWEEGITTEGVVKEVKAIQGPEWQRVATHRSDLLTTLEIVNKRSQNFFSEQVLKLLGARRCDDGSWAGGVRAVRESLTALGIDPAAYELADGSGMARGNLATPQLVTDLLRRMHRHRWNTEFVRTLPYSGEVDLRWERRLSKPPYRGNVLAKTGSLSGVSTLSGYAKGRSGTVYAFSILMNRTSANWQAQNAQDAILRALIDKG